MSIYTFKNIKLAEGAGAYQNIQGKYKDPSRTKHSITLQITDEFEEQFATLVEDMLEQIKDAKDQLGWGPDNTVYLPWNLDTKTLQLSWSDKTHRDSNFLQLKERVAPGVVEDLEPDGVPNIAGGSLISVVVSAKADPREANGQYSEKIWINVEPRLIYIQEVKEYDGYKLTQDSIDKAIDDVLADAYDF
jgi:hypothetical protein